MTSVEILGMLLEYKDCYISVSMNTNACININNTSRDMIHEATPDFSNTIQCKTLPTFFT